ncbi:acetamidase/formamidase family protein [Acidocella sp. C78]|uniref:acetamidase/formamidase family protein n=1 Tax=Acidocella sp. C78 TaxID=1671486 RepID=UPI0020BED557|nr:acetamidase/formamidase family protein [Acidocella sp. C78]
MNEKEVRWSARVVLPYAPHIGTLSTSPEIDSINSLTPGSHGGNMDLPDMGPGSITYLPVRSPGARLFIGDAHAARAMARCAARRWNTPRKPPSVST